MDKKINNNKIIYIFIFFLVTIISIVVRIRGLNVLSIDMKGPLLRWFYLIKNNGGLKALALNIGDYNMPYLTIMALLTYIPISPIIALKMVSIIFDYLLAFFSVRLIKEILKERYNIKIGIIGYSVIILLPTVILNSSFWGQCDSIYVTFIVISLIYLIRERYIMSFVFLGISFSFKLQFIFVLPVYVLYYLSKKKMHLKYFFVIPLVNIIMCIPAILFGKGILDCLKVYLNQTKEYNYSISLNFPGIYSLLFNARKEDNLVMLPNQWISKFMIVLVGIIFFSIALYVIIKNLKFNNYLIIETTVWSVLICTCFLPYMHDRYAYIADVFSIMYCILYGKKKIYVPIGIQISSLYTYLFFLYRINHVDIKFFSLINIIIISLLSISLFKHFKSNSENNNAINIIIIKKLLCNFFNISKHDNLKG